MTKLAMVFFSLPPGEREYWRSILERVCLEWQSFEPLNERGRLQVHAKLDTARPDYGALLAILDQRGVEWWQRIEHEYTPTELRRSILIEASLRRPERDTGEFAYREQFDLSNACPVCGTGAVQVAPLIVNEGALPKTGLMCQTLNHEYLVAEPLALELLRQKRPGLEAIQVQNRRGRPVTWWQLLPRHQMPPFLPESRGTTRGTSPGEICSDTPCEACGRDGYFNNNREPVQLVYERATLGPEPLPDVAHTYEHFGRSVLREPFSESVFAKPLLLVGPRVFDIFHRMKVRGLVFEPITIRDG